MTVPTKKSRRIPTHEHIQRRAKARKEARLLDAEEVEIPQGTIQCPDCQGIFARTTSLKHHLLFQHNKNWITTIGRPENGGRAASNARYYRKNIKKEREASKNAKANRRHYLLKKYEKEGAEMLPGLKKSYLVEVEDRKAKALKNGVKLTDAAVKKQIYDYINYTGYIDKIKTKIDAIRIAIGSEDTFSSKCIIINYFLRQIENRFPGFINLNFNKKEVLIYLSDADYDNFSYNEEEEPVIFAALDDYFNSKSRQRIEDRKFVIETISHHINLVFTCSNHDIHLIKDSKSHFLTTLLTEKSFEYSIDKE
jgi:hypothetical protein